MKGLQRFSLLFVVVAALFLVGCGSKSIDNGGEMGGDGSSSEAIARASQIISSNIILFDFDKYDIRPEFNDVLRQQADLLNAHTSIRIRIEGHTDDRGTEEYNLALGGRRASAVYDYLQRLGVNPSQMETISYGKLRPRVMGSGEAVWSQNRRAEFAIIR